VVGVGVLLLGSAMAKLGWVPGLIMLFGFFPLNMYTGILLSRTRQLLPKSVTMADMAYYTYGKYVPVVCVLKKYQMDRVTDIRTQYRGACCCLGKYIPFSNTFCHPSAP
jgi:hypothetical protein